MKRKFWDTLTKWKDTDILTPLMVVGARQIGKTYIINKFCEYNFEDYIYINLSENRDIVNLFKDDINIDEKIKKMQLYLKKKITEDTVLFVDEVQMSEEFISSLKYMCENEFPYKVICAGSLLGVKLKRFKSFFPVGKVSIVKMYPMDFEEYLIALNNESLVHEIKKCYENDIKMDTPLHNKLMDIYKLYICTGGMPACVNNIINGNLNILNYDDNIINSIIESYISDMNQYTENNSETIKIERIYRNIPSQLAKENKKFQYSKIEQYARKRDYDNPMEWLISSELVLKCNYVNKFETPLKGFSNPDNFKIYLNDTGLLSKVLEIPYNKVLLNEEFMYKGVIAENYVAQQLWSNGFSLYYYSESQKMEVDFLIETNDKIIPIEVKSGENVISKSFKKYIEANKVSFAIRISSKNFGFENNIKSVPLYAVFCIKK